MCTHWSSSYMLCVTQCRFTHCIFMQQNPDSPSGLTPLTFLSQPHLSSSPRVQARVTATATAAEDKACTKAASRVPESKIKHTMQEIHLKCIWELLSVWMNRSPRSSVMDAPWFMTLPNILIPRGVVEQFQRRFLNWCWHWVRWWYA